jgi:uncharacterized repeat protein (TIGR03806 family)
MTPHCEQFKHKSESTRGYLPRLALCFAMSFFSSCGSAEDAAENYGLQKRPLNTTCKAPESADKAPTMLSQTGCFLKDDPKKAAPAMIPYGVNTPLWSDNAQKQRWMAIPEGKTVAVDPATGDFDFPVGSVLAKYFEMDGIALETRFISRLSDGQWAAYTYVFDEEGKDAKLLGEENDYRFIPKGDDALEWGFPSRKACFGCHTKSAKITIGPEIAQLDGDYKYPSGIVANQVQTLRHIGVLDEKTVAPKDLKILMGLKAADASAEQKARSYLHANCSYCHQGDEVKDVTLDLRMDRPLSKMNACDVKPSKNGFGIDAVKLIAPGAPERSMLLFRMKSKVQDVRMPVVGTKLVDEEATKAIETWIGSLKNCDDAN